MANWWPPWESETVVATGDTVVTGSASVLIPGTMFSITPKVDTRVRMHAHALCRLEVMPAGVPTVNNVLAVAFYRTGGTFLIPYMMWRSATTAIVDNWTYYVTLTCDPHYDISAGATETFALRAWIYSLNVPNPPQYRVLGWNTMICHRGAVKDGMTY
jgi:hypothetical protein